MTQDYHGYMADVLEKAMQASEFRLLGFSEKAIIGLLEMSHYQIEETIRKYKDALDLMGDETD